MNLRPGEAGRGFAVVANEVKVLATQMGSAVGEIGNQIDAMFECTSETSHSIARVTEAITELGEATSSIAESASAQGAATVEISHHIKEAATGTNAVRDNLTLLDRQSASTASNAGVVLEAAGSPARMPPILTGSPAKETPADPIRRPRPISTSRSEPATGPGLSQGDQHDGHRSLAFQDHLHASRITVRRER